MKNTDIKVNDKFGDWVVTDINIPSKGGNKYVQCQCKCGEIKNVMSSSLRRGKTSSCRSCAARKTTTQLEIGSKYKDWTILEGPIYKNSTAYYKVKCECGTEMFKLPIELLYKDRDFCCMKCSHKENMNNITTKNGKIGELTKTEHTRLKKSAKKRQYEFNVSIEYLWNLFENQQKICAITGDHIDDFSKASLDRIDSTKGYIEGNVQWVTQQANLSKHIMSTQELYDFCIKVLNHANQQPSTPLTKCEGSETNPWNS